MAVSDPEASEDVVADEEVVVDEGVVVSDSGVVISAVVVSATVDSCLFSIFPMFETASISSESISTSLL